METNPLPQGMHELRNAYLHLIVDEGARLLYSEWVRRPSREEYREAATIFAGYLRDSGIAFWIQDTGRLGEVPVEDLKVVLNELVPVAASSCLRKVARITSDEKNMATFLELARQEKARLSADIEVQQFKTYREAAEWVWSDRL
ncbi:hypothetical protein GCM10023188_19530 [Pontibacter saemangeumensis]|uniref:SpoIIAA-like n=1 Tax=Pontibacter saemangeumensis TaxID=1084525 RepID=A0ABP8LMR1_9BACT